MKHLGISGGGTKISGLFGAAEILMVNKKYKPQIISGISAGAILSVPLALRKFRMIKEMVLNFDLDTIFSQKPVNNKGNLSWRALVNFIKGKPYLGKQKNLINEIKKIITDKDFEQYLSGDYPDCIIGTVDFETGSRKYFNLKELDYNTYLKAVNASASLPVFTEGTKFKGQYLFDGGVRDHIATGWILDNFPDIKETISIYSRPEDFRAVKNDFYPKNVIKILERHIEITNVEISKNDEKIEDHLCKENGIKQTKIFLPRIMESVYDINKERVRKMYEEGRNAALYKYKS